MQISVFLEDDRLDQNTKRKLHLGTQHSMGCQEAMDWNYGESIIYKVPKVLYAVVQVAYSWVGEALHRIVKYISYIYYKFIT